MQMIFHLKLAILGLGLRGVILRGTRIEVRWLCILLSLNDQIKSRALCKASVIFYLSVVEGIGRAGNLQRWWWCQIETLMCLQMKFRGWQSWNQICSNLVFTGIQINQNSVWNQAQIVYCVLPYYSGQLLYFSSTHFWKWKLYLKTLLEFGRQTGSKRVWNGYPLGYNK